MLDARIKWKKLENENQIRRRRRKGYIVTLEGEYREKWDRGGYWGTKWFVVRVYTLYKGTDMYVIGENRFMFYIRLVAIVNIVYTSYYRKAVLI